jgi:hypothetical protein
VSKEKGITARAAHMDRTIAAKVRAILTFMRSARSFDVHSANVNPHRNGAYGQDGRNGDDNNGGEHGRPQALELYYIATLSGFQSFGCHLFATFAKFYIANSIPS